MQDDGSYACATIVNSLHKKFRDLFVFNTQKLFNPKYCPRDKEVHKTMVEKLIIKFGLTAVESDPRRAELLEFVKNLRHVCDTNRCVRHGGFVGASMSGMSIGHFS
jgi:hypothetical protein